MADGCSAPTVLVPTNGTIVDLHAGDHPKSRDAAVAAAAAWAQQAGLAQHAVMLTGEMGAAHVDDDKRVRIVIVWVGRAAMSSCPAPEGTAWREVASTTGTPRGRFIFTAVQRALSTREPDINIPSELTVAAQAARRPRLRGVTPEAATCQSVAERAEAANAECAKLRRLLRDQTGPPEWRDFAARMADRIGDCSAENAPAGLREKRFDLSAEKLELRRFRHIKGRVSRPKLERGKPPADDGWRPHWIDEILSPRAHAALEREIDVLRAWCDDMVAGKDVASSRPRGIALGLSDMTPRARAVVNSGSTFDLRAGPGRVFIIRGDAPLLPAPLQHLDTNFIRTALAGSADEELVSMFDFASGGGVNFRDELPPQIVILPPLLSLFEGIHQAAAEIGELAQRGWYTLGDHIPTFPFRCPGRGTVPRKDGVPRRGIVDQGGPRKQPLLTRFGREPVHSLNERSKAAGWGGEPKPTLEQAAGNHACLLRLADISGVCLIVIAIDFRYFFHQFLFEAAQVWKMGAMLPVCASPGGGVAWQFGLELVMSMGARPSSRVAQRFANELMALLLLQLQSRCAIPRQGARRPAEHHGAARDARSR